MRDKTFEDMPILAQFKLDENVNTIMLHPRTDDSPKGRFSTKSTGFMGSDKVQDRAGNKYQVNFQVIKIGSKP